MTVELYFAPGACSFVPHAGLEIVRAATGRDFTPEFAEALAALRAVNKQLEAEGVRQ